MRLAKLVGRENAASAAPTAASPRARYLQRVHPSIQWAKLRALAEGAQLATQELWGRVPEPV